MSDHPTREPPGEGDLCTTAQTRNGPIWDNRGSHGRECARITIMLFTIAALVAVSAALIVYQARVAGRGAQGNLGWMSPQWIAENRSSHRS
jgi:hypothetical protein